MSEAKPDFAAFAAAIPALMDKKRKLLAKGLTQARCNCVWCGAEGAMAIGVAGRKNHIRAHCTSARTAPSATGA